MEINGKSLLRHFFLFLILLFSLYLLNKETFGYWVKEHWFFLSGWLVAMILVGMLGDVLARYYQRHLALTAEEKAALAWRETWLRRLFYQWINCSRCAGFWMAGVVSLLLCRWYFPVEWGAVALLAYLYFFLTGASLGAAAAIAVYLRRIREG